MSEVEIRTQGPTLELERVIPAPRGAVWRCWTEAALLKRWYCPKPWSVAEAEFDLRPGGRMNVTMQGPAGERIEANGIWLEIAPGERLAFTDAYGEGFVPRQESFMTGYVRLSDAEGGGTRLVWGARHKTEAEAKKHLEMGFEPGWTAASAQLAALAAEIAAEPGGAIAFKAKARTCLWLGGDIEQAAELYVSLLPDSRIDAAFKPGPGAPAMVVEFTLAGAPCMMLAGNDDPTPSPLTSFSVLTADQAETDRLWRALTAEGGEPGRCGWLKDRFGVHWQIVPEALPRLMHGGDAAASGRVREAMMGMGKIEIAALQAAFDAA